MSWSAAAERVAPDAEPVPGTAPGVFGDRLPLAERYVELLLGPGAERGLIGPREAPRIWSRHVLACAVVADAVPLGARVVDLGSGAGLPGIPLALARPDLDVTLVEPMARRAAFLREVADDLGLRRVTVVRSRAEEHASSAGASYDVATARAVADLATLFQWARPLLRAGGTLVAIKGARATDEIDAAQEVLRAAGAIARVTRVGEGVVEPAATVVLVATRSSA